SSRNALSGAEAFADAFVESVFAPFLMKDAGRVLPALDSDGSGALTPSGTLPITEFVSRAPLEFSVFSGLPAPDPGALLKSLDFTEDASAASSASACHSLSQR